MEAQMKFSVIALIVLVASPAIARDNGQYAQSDPQIRQWFRSQVSPKTGIQCCSEADGVFAEEDIRDGHYWIRFPQSNGEWMQVPDDVVIKDPNRNGAPVVWWYYSVNRESRQRELKIRCYAVGSGA
jgi:hypothetical protein